MNIVKRIISTICASVFAFSCFEFNANAKVIEPEIVKTETWTTSYYIDDDMDTLYPYIQCQTDIYNDGTLKLYMWNTHEWGGSSPIKQFVTICEKTKSYTSGSAYYDSANLFYGYNYDKEVLCKDYVPPISNSLFSGVMECLLSGDGWADDGSYNLRMLDPDMESENKETLKNLNWNLHPMSYYIDMVGNIGNIFGSYDGIYLTSPICLYTISTNKEGSSESKYCTVFYSQKISVVLGKMKVYNKAEDNNLVAVYHPVSEPKNIYSFHLYGHDITITPELLSGNIVAEPELTEQEKYIKQLEEENSKLKTEIESYKKLDFDGDGLLTNADAQMILVYYTDSLVDKASGKVEDYFDYVKQISC